MLNYIQGLSTISNRNIHYRYAFEIIKGFIKTKESAEGCSMERL
jgi:hypothetical protein